MYKFFLVFIAITLSSGSIAAQTKLNIPNQLAYFSFDNPAKVTTDDSGNGSSAFLSAAEPQSVCGINGGNALKFKGIEYIQFVDMANSLSAQDFTLSLYIKPLGLVGSRDIFTKKDSCGQGVTLSIAYNASNKTMVCLLRDKDRSTTVTAKIDDNACWQHVVLMREVATTKLFINGTLRDSKATADGKRIKLLSTAIAAVAKSPCDPQTVNGHFQGSIDEVRLFNAALTQEQIDLLYYPQDHIATLDTLIYLGNTVKITNFKTCAPKFSWSPSVGVDNTIVQNPTIKPTQTTLYTLKYIDGSSCTAYDTLRIRVVDPANVPCGEVFVPNAFTPNNDGRNDELGISNPYSMEKLLTFEILDRWGNRVFVTDDPFKAWDGTYSGQLVNPGLFIYRLRYMCAGVEKSQVGNLNVIK